MEWALRITKPDAVVLDQFMGSGTTLKVAKEHGRKCIGIEIDERFAEVAAKRCQAAEPLFQPAPLDYVPQPSLFEDADA
jgi:DNA modification methylase